ncbi:hypothetical protein B0T25DRAFT_557273 [Lasiosphaeria hispida]|uniref:Subtilisin-like serine protease n=1 Tax=Lasiosphaeria hispida TaxID=260671 RepID=A0AAJ0MA04_9PEZI|nr:hypothetical protein B0T25DRAFT_557273 [Lasiosphaeria hispida]
MKQNSHSEPRTDTFPPPFTPNQSISSLETCLANLPASALARGQIIRPARELPLFLQSQLEPQKIDRVYGYLWFARDRVLQARPLHRHSVARRYIVLTESPSEHLVSDYSVIFVKPLPEYILSYEFWQNHLSRDPVLHSNACGLLLSYTWLVAYKTDFEIAKEARLLPEGLTWNSWTAIASDLLDYLDASETRLVGRRYLFGELRMSRLNYIYEFLPSLWLTHMPMRGFMPTSMWNGSFAERNVGRLLGIFVFFSLVLSAMQVGLATRQLGNEPAFVSTAYGFAVASLCIVTLCAIASFVILVWHVRYKVILPWRMGLREIGVDDLSY